MITLSSLSLLIVLLVLFVGSSESLSAEERAWLKREKEMKRVGAAGFKVSATQASNAAAEQEQEIESNPYGPEVPLRKGSTRELRLARGSVYVPDAHVIELSAADYDDTLHTALAASRHVYIQFYANYCNFCKAIAPVWSRLAAHYARDPRIVFARLNAERSGALLAKYGLRGFPNMLLFSPGADPDHPELFRGQRTFETLLTWLSQRIGPPAIPASDSHAHYHEKMLRQYQRMHPTIASSSPSSHSSETVSPAAAADANPTLEPADRGKAATDEESSSSEQHASQPADDSSLHDLDVGWDEARAFDGEDFEPTEASTFLASGGTRLAYYAWQLDVDDPADASSVNDDASSTASSAESGVVSTPVVILLHSLGGHATEYAALVDALYPRGVTLYSFDFRGHGQSPGARGHLEQWDTVMDDLRLFVALVRRRERVRSLFLMGHELGATVALHYQLYQPHVVRGIIALGPLLQSPLLGGTAPSRATGAPAFLLSAAASLWPSFDLQRASLTSNDYSSDLSVGRRLGADPLHHDSVSVATAEDIELAALRLLTSSAPASSSALQGAAAGVASELKCPLLLVVGDQDRISPPHLGSQLFELVAAADKTLHRLASGSSRFFDEYDNSESQSEIRSIWAWILLH